MAKKWMIYGAYGYNGEIIANYAAERGLSPILAGRDESKLAPVATRNALEQRAFSLDDRGALGKALADVDLVLHCAGPYSHTGPPMLDACINTQTHYLDITGEINQFEIAFNDFAPKAEQNDVILIPGVGFDVVPTDCLAAMLKKAMPDATTLTLGLDASLIPGAGAAMSMLEGFKTGNRVRQKGKLKSVSMAHKFQDIPFLHGSKPGMSIPWGDVTTAYHSTGIENIEVFMGLPISVEPLKEIINMAQPFLAMDMVQNPLKQIISGFVGGESEEARQDEQSYVWGEVTNPKGERKSMQLKLPHPIEHTAHAALGAAEALLKKPGKKGGTFTPSMFFGEEFVLGLPEVELQS